MQRHELLRHHRMAADCVFSLWLAFGAGPDRDEVDFTEFHDYPPRPGGGNGREYAYSVYVAGRDLDRMATTWARRCRRPPAATRETTLLESFRALIEQGELGAHLAIEQNVRHVRSWLDEAGIGYRDDRWAWINSD
jgi:hypothetical protein